MKITYIHHSSFLAETDNVLLLFDFTSGSLPDLTPEKPLVILASHSHSDHFDPVIFDLAKLHKPVRFVLSDDIEQNRIPDECRSITEFIEPGMVLSLPEDGGIKITAFKSTDEGVAFIVETGADSDGEKRILYHAGDLNDWRWNGEPLDWNNNMRTNYMQELEKIRGCNFHIDAAMVPLDGRQEDLFSSGLDTFMGIVGADKVFPMHLWNDYDIIPRFKALPCAEKYRNRIVEISREGQCFSC